MIPAIRDAITIKLAAKIHQPSVKMVLPNFSSRSS